MRNECPSIIRNFRLTFKSDSAEWIGNFQRDWTNFRMVIELSSSKLLIIASGTCYIMSPDQQIPISVFGVGYEVILNTKKGMYVLQDQTDLTILDEFGNHSHSERISCDGIKELSFDNLNKKLIASGFYYNRNPEKAEGYFLVNLSPEGNLEKAKLQAFNDRFVSDLEGKDSRNNRGVMNINIADLILRQDGGLLIIGEESQDMERRINNMNRMMYDNFSRSIIDYYYNDIFIIAINPDGEFHWQSSLYKKQYPAFLSN